jgi:hypothetical protein
MTGRLTGVAALILLLAMALAACTAQDHPGPPTGTTAPAPSRPAASRPANEHNLVEDGYAGRFRVTTTVLESKDHGPQLCGFMLTSMPPYCGGSAIVGWTWKGLRAESVGGTTWGVFTIVGTWNDATKEFTLTEPATDAPAGVPPPKDIGSSFRSPCPTPDGGWHLVDRSRATQAAQHKTISVARVDPDYGGAWVDQASVKVAANSKKRAVFRLQFVLNISFTRDLARHEAELRRLWGGALCVRKALRTKAEVKRIQAEVQGQVQDMILAGMDEVTSTAHATVWLARASQQREFDARYGKGVVILNGWLEPID